MAGDTIDLSAKDTLCWHLASAEFSPWRRAFGRTLLENYGCTVEVLEKQWAETKWRKATACCPLSAFAFPTHLLPYSPLLPQACVTLPTLLLFCPAGLLILNVDAPAKLLGTLQAQEGVHTHARKHTGYISVWANKGVLDPFSQKTGDSAIQWGAACDTVPFVPKPSESDGREEKSKAGRSK